MEESWIWGAPLPEGIFNAAVFLDPRYVAKRSPGNLDNWYRSLLAQSSLLLPVLRGNPIESVRVCDATSRYIEMPATQDMIHVGEAAFSIDPLSSQGVQKAMVSAMQGAIVVHTVLTAPENTDTAIAFYKQHQKESVIEHATIAAHWYGERAKKCATNFWRERAPQGTVKTLKNSASIPRSFPLSNTLLCLSESTRISSMGIIDKNLIRPSRVVSHPTLDRPVAFLGGHPVVELLSDLGTRRTVDGLLRIWAQRLSRPIAVQILNWLWNHQILVPVKN